MPKNFVHLHLHTEYSMLDGLGSIEDRTNAQGYVSRLVEHGMPAGAITDHGYVTGWPEWYKACRTADIEPILGCEFYHVDDHSYRPPKGEGQAERYHVVMLAKGYEGYKILSELSTTSHRQFYYKPLIDRATLEALGDATEHLVVLSGCANSRLSQMIRAEDMEAAREELQWWRETFPHYYIELQHHDTDFDRRLNEGLIQLAQRHHIPWVITNDPHYVVRDDCGNHDALLAIQTASDIDDPNRFKFDGHGYHLRSRSEMRAAFRRYGDEIWKPGAAQTLDIARECRVRVPQWESRTWQIPRFPDVPEGETSFSYLKRQVKDALAERGLADDPTYVQPLKPQLKAVKDTGIADFLLITADIVNHARDIGIPVGPGRGSVCGSEVSWLLDIHKIDPIRYKLLAERFLNPARPSMPDIDTDFGKARRSEMFDYVIEKYGIDNVVLVCTYGSMKLKKAFQSLAGAYGIPFNERMRLSKQIIEDEDSGDFILPKEIEERFPGLHAQLKRLSGVKCQVSAHPAGVIIADPSANIREQVPEMFIASSKKMVGQYDLYAADRLGLLKEDFLGLRALDTIDEAVQLIAERTGTIHDPDDWVPDHEPGDKKVWKMLAKGETEGVFQMEGKVNQRGCKDVKPACFEDVVSITALYRTGPIDAGFPERFIANRSAGKVKWSHKALEQFLGETWGVILYQEQVMDIAHELAGFDMAQVDDIKEAIKHKNPKIMKELRPKFIDGCKNKGIIPTSVAKELWDAIEGYSGYSYNRSHAVAYTMTTYQTARLKRLWPVDYTCALLRTVPPDKDNLPKRQGYLRNAIRKGITILPPHINISQEYSYPEGESSIRFGFVDIKGIGASTAARIVNNRPEGGYTDIEQVKTAVNHSGSMEVLRSTGVLADLGVTGSEQVLEDLLGWQFSDRMAKYRAKHDDILDPPETALDLDDVCIVGEVISKKESQTKAGKAMATWQVRMSITEVYNVRLWEESKAKWDIPTGTVVLIRGRYEPRWENISVASAKQIKVVKFASQAA